MDNQKIVDTVVYRLNLQTVANNSIIKFFLENGVVGTGYRVKADKDYNIDNIEEYRSLALKTYPEDSRKINTFLNVATRMNLGDILWVKINDKFFLGRIKELWKYVEGGKFDSYNIHNIFGVDLIEVDTETLSKKVNGSFFGGGIIQRVNYPEVLAESLKILENYDKNPQDPKDEKTEKTSEKEEKIKEAKESAEEKSKAKDDKKQLGEDFKSEEDKIEPVKEELKEEDREEKPNTEKETSSKPFTEPPKEEKSEAKAENSFQQKEEAKDNVKTEEVEFIKKDNGDMQINNSSSKEVVLRENKLQIYSDENEIIKILEQRTLKRDDTEETVNFGDIVIEVYPSEDTPQKRTISKKKDSIIPKDRSLTLREEQLHELAVGDYLDDYLKFYLEFRHIYLKYLEHQRDFFMQINYLSLYMEGAYIKFLTDITKNFLNIKES